MVRVLLRVVEALLLGLIGYNLMVAGFGWRHPTPTPAGQRRRRFRVVVPSHNEEGVIAGVLADIADQDYPEDLYNVWVVADRCTDRTADVAREAGANVEERTEGPDGKGPALSWYLIQHPLEHHEAIVVLDADNRVSRNLLTLLADRLDQGHEAIQAYLDVSNPDASAIATASALSYWSSNRMVQLARHNLRWPVDLGGTGMCLTARALDYSEGFGQSVTEDQELGVKLFLSGITVAWAHDIKIEDEKPTRPIIAMRQRARWATGRRQVARRYLRALLAEPTLPSIDLMIRLVQPSRMGLAGFSAVLAAISWMGAPLLPAALWTAMAALQVVAPIPFLARDGVPLRYLARYPVLALLPLLKVPARLFRQRGWYHTPHGG